MFHFSARSFPPVYVRSKTWIVSEKCRPWYGMYSDAGWWEIREIKEIWAFIFYLLPPVHYYYQNVPCARTITLYKLKKNRIHLVSILYQWNAFKTTWHFQATVNSTMKISPLKRTGSRETRDEMERIQILIASIDRVSPSFVLNTFTVKDVKG